MRFSNTQMAMAERKRKGEGWGDRLCKRPQKTLTIRLISLDLIFWSNRPKESRVTDVLTWQWSCRISEQRVGRQGCWFYWVRCDTVRAQTREVAGKTEGVNTNRPWGRTEQWNRGGKSPWTWVPRRHLFSFMIISSLLNIHSFSFNYHLHSYRSYIRPIFTWILVLYREFWLSHAHQHALEYNSTLS